MRKEKDYSDTISIFKHDIRASLPFVGYVLMQTPVFVMPEKDEKKGNIAYTDGLNIFLSKKILEAPKAELNFVLAHEVGHILFKTFLRERGKNPLLWNYATDYAINQILIESNIDDRILSPFQNCLYKPKFSGWTAEKIYDYIFHEVNKIKLIIREADLNVVLGGKCIDPKTSDKNSSGKSEDEIDAEITQRIAQAHQRALQDTQSRGIGKGLFMEYVEVALSRQVSWREILRKTLRCIGFEQNDFSRPSRRAIVNRSLGCKFWFPRLAGMTSGDIMMVVDTSGSVSQKSLSVFLGEINSCLRVMPRTKVHLFCADCGIKFMGTFSGKLPEVEGGVEIYGRGGTSFEPAFKEAEKLLKKNQKFETMIYFTDGECYYPSIKDSQLPFKVIWCLNNTRSKAPFGKTIHINPNN